MKHKQKNSFFVSESDAWFDRNHEAINNRNYDESNPIIQAVHYCLVNAVKDSRCGRVTLLEVCCGEGKRLQ